MAPGSRLSRCLRPFFSVGNFAEPFDEQGLGALGLVSPSLPAVHSALEARRAIRRLLAPLRTDSCPSSDRRKKRSPRPFKHWATPATLEASRWLHPDHLTPIPSALPALAKPSGRVEGIEGHPFPSSDASSTSRPAQPPFPAHPPAPPLGLPSPRPNPFPSTASPNVPFFAPCSSFLAWLRGIVLVSLLFLAPATSQASHPVAGRLSRSLLHKLCPVLLLFGLLFFVTLPCA